VVLGAVFDCTRCGACCSNPDENRAERFLDYVEVLPRDRLFRKPEQRRRLTVVNEAGGIHMRLDPDHRCVALRGKLGQRVHCAIYEDRPTGCRLVEAGGVRCRQYRRERDIDA
jgi:Fe-S-cluster containining protein